MLAGLGESTAQADTAPTPIASRDSDPEYERLRKLMGWDPATVDMLVNRSGLTADEVSSMLLILELEGSVDPLAGGFYIQREEGPKR